MNDKNRLIGKTTRGENVWLFHTPEYCLDYIRSYNRHIGYWLRSIRQNGRNDDRITVLKECVLERNRFQRILKVVLEHEPD